MNADTTCCYSLPIDPANSSGAMMEPLQRYAFSDTLLFNGVITADPNHQVYVSTPMKGFLTSVYFHPGERVLKGELLAVLEHNNYSQLQLDYLETKGRYDYLKIDYSRQGELGLENAASLKTVQKAQSDFISVETKLYALKKQLQFVGIDPDSIHLNNIVSAIRILAPITGIVSSDQMSVGQLYTEETPLLRISDYSKLLIVFSVPQEALMLNLKNIVLPIYSLPKSGKQYSVTTYDSTPIEQQDGSFAIYAELKNADPDLSPGMKVKSSLSFTDSVYAIPTEAIMHYIDGDYVYTEKREGCYRLNKINPGRIQGSMTEILNAESELISGKMLVAGFENLIPCKESK
jgi:membrane fusion protein, heavy metal efflux system